MQISVEQIELTRAFVKSFHQGEATGHDWFHVQRVTHMAKKIGQIEGANLPKIEIIALLHDVADHKLNNGNEKAGLKKVNDFLNQINIPSQLVKEVLQDIDNISYKGAKVEQSVLSTEGKIVQDADRIDALGAIGIARTFAYGGHKNRIMYDPNSKIEMHADFDSYKSSTAPTINHFYEKLLLLKDRMNTKTAKLIAEERHQYMVDFLAQFYAEWNDG